jgi:hypothetical protein
MVVELNTFPVTFRQKWGLKNGNQLWPFDPPKLCRFVGNGCYAIIVCIVYDALDGPLPSGSSVTIAILLRQRDQIRIRYHRLHYLFLL